MFSYRITAFGGLLEVESVWLRQPVDGVAGRAPGTSATDPYRLPNTSLAALALRLLRACPSPKPVRRLTGS